MFSPKLMEKVAQGQQFDRLHDAEIDRLLKGSNSGSSIKLKLSVMVSGAALVLLMIAQIV
jgi:hypothetical protein